MKDNALNDKLAEMHRNVEGYVEEAKPQKAKEYWKAYARGVEAARLIVEAQQ
jgi:hypothetical protein